MSAFTQFSRVETGIDRSIRSRALATGVEFPTISGSDWHSFARQLDPREVPLFKDGIVVFPMLPMMRK
jgi:hypothetical protein